MLFKNFKDYFKKELLPIYDEHEIDSFFYIILENLHNLKRIDLALHPEMEVSHIDVEKWNKILLELINQKPIQYILGETEFFGLHFKVNEFTLIPRQETEELVNWIITDNKKKKEIKILDIGTGSGCIAVSLAKCLPNAIVFAIDVSENALEIAKENATLNRVEVLFFQKNILETDNLEQQFDIIVSNPPYVRMLEKEEIKPNVLEFEPHLALFVENNDALLFYKKIATLAKINLKPNGLLYFEINQYLGNEMTVLLQNMNFTAVELRKDIYGNDRMIKAQL